MDDVVLLEAVRSGDADAFSGIIQKYQMRVTRYLYRMTGDWETAKDLAQDTFIQAYKSIIKSKINSSFQAWLYRVATNNSHQFFRKSKSKRATSLEATAGEEYLATKDSTNSVIENLIIKETLLLVDKDKRICLLLHFWEGFKYREISEIIGISEEAVRKRVARGCQEFRKQYQLHTGDRI